MSNSKSKSSIGKRKSGSKTNTDSAEYRAPSMLHEQVVVTLRREKDSLQLALSSELHHRRALEQENETLKRQLLEQERELRDVKISRERLEEELRGGA